MEGTEKEPVKPTAGKAHVPGEGIRSLKTSGVFRALNFELYTKPVGITTMFNFIWTKIVSFFQGFFISFSE